MATRSKLIQKQLKDADLQNMFNSMIGATDPDPNIAIPKHEQIYKHCTDIIAMLNKFATSPLIKVFPEYDLEFGQILTFAAKSEAELKQYELEKSDGVLSKEELLIINTNPDKLKLILETNNSAGYKLETVGPKYRALKESAIIKVFAMYAKTVKELLEVERVRAKGTEHNLSDKTALKSEFLVNAEGDYIKVFDFSDLDFKLMVVSGKLNADMLHYMLLTMRLLFDKSQSILQVITTPDVNVDAMSNLLINNIDQIKRAVPGCDEAFAKLHDSCDLLKGNFNGYYRDFVQSKNPNIFMENFIYDVADKFKTEGKVAGQFRKIVDYFRKKTTGKIADPKVVKMLDLASENINILFRG